MPVLEGLTLTDTLPACRAARRWKARDAHGAPFTACRVQTPPDVDHATLRDRLAPLVNLAGPHLLRIERLLTDERGRIWAISPYTGNHDGLVTLASLLPQKDGGQMSPDEAERAIGHVLEALAWLHEHNLHHGPLRADELLVDRHGSVLVELPGVLRFAQGLNRGDAELVRDEIHSLGLIAYQLITGLEPGTPRIPAARLVKRLPRAWDTWIETALDESAGFFTVAEAAAALPSSGNATTTAGVSTPDAPQVRTLAGNWLRRFPGVSR
ncbi:MAG: hypothetical protein KDA21_08800 [Phycisphaerales bacterium]|nr:hypothetical protein [Phycisphaerales bacterium]